MLVPVGVNCAKCGRFFTRKIREGEQPPSLCSLHDGGVPEYLRLYTEGQ